MSADDAALPPRQLPVVRVFLSSPGDVAEERDIAQDVIERVIAKRSAFYDRATIRCVRYDDPDRQIPLVANLSAQEAVNVRLPPPRYCNVVVAILRARMGTPLETPRKPNGLPYLSGTEWEIEDALRPDSRAEVLIYRNTVMPAMASDDDAVMDQLEQRKLLNAFVDRLQRPAGRGPRFVECYQGAAAFRVLLEQNLDAILYSAVEKAAPVAPGAPPPPRFAANPYPGLAPYGPNLAEVYCGREAEIAGLLRMVVEAPEGRRHVAVVGVSGSGKSSLAKAGLTARLRATGWITEDFRLRADPVADVIERLGRLAGEGDPGAAAADWRVRLPGLLDAALAGDREGLLLLIDQFEEASGLSDDARAGLVDLLGALRDCPRVRVVLTLRSDFVPDVTRDPRLAGWLSGAIFLVAPPGPAALAEILAEPAARAGFSIEPALRDALVDRAAGAAGALPLVCFTLRRLVEAARAAGATVLRLPPEAGADPLGWALADHIAATEAGLGEGARAALPGLFRLLVRVGEDGRETKRRAGAADLVGAQAEVAEALVAARLLTRLDAGEVELAHEALLLAWRSLADWLKARRGFLAARDEIERQRANWAGSGEEDGRLLPNWLIAEGLRLDAEVPDLLTAAQRAYLTSSRAERDAFWARDSRRLAELAAAQTARGDHVTAALLALEGLPDRDRAPDRPILPECFSALWLAECARREERVLAGLGATITGFAFSYDGARLATGHGDGAARLWDAATGREITLFAGHDSKVNSVAFSPDGKRLATGSDDCTARLWDAATGHQITCFAGHKGAVASVAFSPDGTRLATGSGDRTARLWGAATRDEIAYFSRHEDWVRSVAFSPDGKRLATGSDDRTARLWDADTGGDIARLDGHGGWVLSAAFSPDGARLATGSGDGAARLWDADTGHEIARLDGHEVAVTSVAFSPDGTRLATGSGDHTARLWDADTGREIARLGGHEGTVNSVAFSCDGKRLATGSEDGTARFWDAAAEREVTLLVGHAGPVTSVAFWPDGPRPAGVSVDCAARLATASLDGTARLWDAATGRQIALCKGHGSWVNSVAFSHDGARLATGTDDGAAWLWDAATGREIARLDGDGRKVLSVAVSSDGVRFAISSGDGAALLWGADAEREIARFDGHRGKVFSAALAPDGAHLATGSGDGVAQLWDAATGCELARLDGHGGIVRSVAFSRDGKRLAAVSGFTARVWDAATEREIARLEGYGSLVKSVAFSPDGARLATGTHDGMTRLWDAATGREIARFDGNGGSVNSVAFSPDGARLATGSYDGKTRLWPLPGDLHDEIAAIRARLPRTLTDEQRARFHLPPLRG